MNLKTAARRLGVHYQTAYRWVRTGQLVAVKVGAGYEISDAALARFQAQRSALERIPDVTPRTNPVVPSARIDALTTLDAMVDATTVDASALFQRAVAVVANVVGDGAALFLGPADTPAPLTAFDHEDPVRAVLMGAVLHLGRPDKAMYADRVRTTETALLVPQVPQREVRSMLRPEFHQVLGEVGFYSAVTVPVVIDGVVAGSLFAGRDTPGRPYTPEDRDFFAAVASRVGLAATRAAAGRRAWTVRARLAEDLAVHSAAEDAVARATEWLNGSAANGDQAIVLVDLDMNVVAITKGCAAVMGASVPDAVGSPLEKLLRPFDAVHSTFERLVAGELDYATVVTGAANSETSLVLDAVMVRGPDATPCCVAYVAHERPEASNSA